MRWIMGNFAMLRANLQNLRGLVPFLGSQACAMRALPSVPYDEYAPRQCEVNTMAGLPVCCATFCVRRV